jgi:hypothetical protein
VDQNSHSLGSKIRRLGRCRTFDPFDKPREMVQDGQKTVQQFPINDEEVQVRMPPDGLDQYPAGSGCDGDETGYFT